MRKSERQNLTIAVVGLVVAFAVFGYRPLLDSLAAQRATAEATRYAAQAQLALSQGASLAVRTDANQSWLVYLLAFGALGVLAVVALRGQWSGQHQPREIVREVYVVLPASSQQARRMLEDVRRGGTLVDARYTVLEVER